MIKEPEPSFVTWYSALEWPGLPNQMHSLMGDDESVQSSCGRHNPSRLEGEGTSYHDGS